LINIKDQLTGYQFANNTRAERHNLKCFKDFMNFLNFNIENNSKNYIDYRYGESKSNKTIDLFRQEMLQYLETFYSNNSKDLVDKFNLLENRLESDEEREKFYKLIFCQPVSAIVVALMEKSVEELYQSFLVEIKKLNKEEN